MNGNVAIVWNMAIQYRRPQQMPKTGQLGRENLGCLHVHTVQARIMASIRLGQTVIIDLH